MSKKILRRIYFCLLVTAVVCILIPAAADPFSIVLLPDTQYYSLSHPATYIAQTRWIVDNTAEENIQAAIHLGDITNNNTLPEWNRAKAAHQVLDLAGVTYSVVPGNHDNPEGGHKRDTTRYNDKFGPAVFSGKSWYGGHYGSTNDSNYIYFSAAGLDFLVLSLEFSPRKPVLTWANEIISNHPNHRVIVVTHCYQASGGDHQTDCACAYDLTGSAGNDLFTEVIRRHSNIFLVLSGHISDSELRTRTGLAGNTIYEVLTDYQREPNGGNGWLRLVTFDPASDSIEFRSLSVLGYTSLSHSAYSSDPSHQDHTFSLYYDMHQGPVYSYLSPLTAVTDFTVNSVGSGQQNKPSIAVNSEGNSVVVWEDDQDENGYYQIKARGFNALGEETFGDITVNSVSSGQQYNPDVAIDETGDFYVVWEDDQDNNGKYQVYLRGFTAAGAGKFADIQVNPSASGQHRYPAVSSSAGGDTVVTWQDDTDGNGLYQVHACGFNAAGARRFPRITVNSVASGQQLRPDIASSAGGDFVVVWEDDKDRNGFYQILASGFYADGTRKFNDRTVNSVSDGQQYAPVIAMDAAGNFVVAWEDDKDGNGIYQILARGFYAGGTERISDFTVNSVSDGQQYKPAIGMDTGGNFVVVWEDDKDKNGWYQILLRGFNAGGTEILGDRAVNRCSSGQQYAPAVGVSEAGIFFTTWQDDKDENGFYEILMNGKIY